MIVMSKYRNKILVLMSNYSSNKELNCFKYDKIKSIIEMHRISYLFPNYPWYLREDIFKRNRGKKH